MGYLSKQLPEELVQSLSIVMMPDLVPRIKSVWLDSAVPVSLRDIDKFEAVISAVRGFCNTLAELKYTGFDELQEWVSTAPKVWLTKCKETALDTVRVKMAQGLGDSKEVERVETQTVSRTEGRELAANGAPAATDDDDWGAAWDDAGNDAAADTNADETANAAPGANEEDGTDAWGWGQDETTEEAPADTVAAPAPQTIVEDDAGEAWGWDDEAAEEPNQDAVPRPRPTNPPTQTREMTLKETYNISSMPEPVLALISAILEDGATLIG
jgi:centromere/kinetochore protein ZW10